MRTIVTSACLLILVIAAAAQTPDAFRTDPIKYFTSHPSRTWVGSGLYFQANYTDTLHFSADSTGKGLSIRRTLVNADKNTAISRGTGRILPTPGDTVYAVRWSEKSYPSVTGRMRWSEGQWVITFDGEWKDWSINVRRDSAQAMVAAAARMIPGLHPIELTAMTYRPSGR